MLAKSHYRALVAQERQTARNYQNQNFGTEETPSQSGKKKNSIKKLKNFKVTQELSELLKISDDELVKDMFDYD